MRNITKYLIHKFQKTMKKFFERFTYGITVLSVIFWSLGPAAFPLQASAATGTAVSDATNNFLRLKASSAFASAVKITIGSNDNNKGLNEILLSMKPKNGTNPTFTAATSTDLADLSASSSSGSGITLWRDNGNGTFSATDDTNIPLSSPLFGATDASGTALPVLPAATTTLATDQVYFIAVKSKATPVNNNAFSIQVASITAAAAPLAINLFETPPIGIDTQGPSIISFNGGVGTTGAQVRFSEPVQKVGGGNITWTSGSDPLTYVDAPEDGEPAQSTTALSHTAGQDSMTVTFSRNITSNDLSNTIAPAANKIMDMAGNVAATTTPRTMGNPIQITTPSLTNGSASSTYTATLAGSGGMGATAWSTASTSDATVLSNLGLTLNSATGVLSGTIPSGVSAGTYNVNFKYQDNVTSAKVTTGAAGANAWTVTAGNYTPVLGDIVLYRNITDAPTTTAWGLVTNATNTNQNTFAINGANLTASKSYQLTKLYVTSNTSAVAATTDVFSSNMNFADGDLVFYPTNVDATAFGWGLVTTAENVTSTNASNGTLRINNAILPVYNVGTRITKFAPFQTSRITVGAAGANPWSANVGTYATPLPGDVILYRNITDASSTVNWGVMIGNPGMTTNQNDLKVNGQALVATKQYQISKISSVQTSNIDGLVGYFVSNQMNFGEGDLVFAPLANSSTTPNFNWTLVTGGAGTYNTEFPPETASPVNQLKLNGNATGVVLTDFAYAPPITKLSPTSSNTTRNLSIGVSSASGGAPPGIASVSPDFGAVSTTVASVVVTGTNTSFSGSSVIEIIKPSDQSIISTTSTATNSTIQISNVSSTGATNLKFRAVIGSAVASGQYSIRIGQVFRENVFNVGSAVAAGLNLITPTDVATGVQIPPLFSFNPSTNASTTSYRITLKTTQDFSGNAVWDYAFPKPNATNSNNSHCPVSGSCNVQYGPGIFNVITQPTPLSANTQYYWKVQTYSVAEGSVGSAVPLESTDVRSFTTTASVTDSELPNITHRPITVAIRNASLIMYARIFDNIATPTSNPALSGTLLYCTGSACTPTTEINGVFVGSGYFSFTIPSNIVTNTLGTIIRYKFRANDGSNTQTKDNSGQPFQITTIDGGAGSISGTVKDSTGTCSNSVKQANVFIEGSGFSTTTSNVDCTYVLAGLPTSTYSVVALKDGFGDRKVDAQVGMSSVAIQLTQGVQGGVGGDVTNPRVKFTGPQEGFVAPSSDSNFKSFVVFDKAMSQNSVTAANALTVNFLDPTNGSSTDITSRGTWVFYPSNPNIQGLPPEGNMAVWTLSQTACGGPCTFGSNKTVVVKVTGSVTDTAGNPIVSNMPDGSFTFSFTTGQTAIFDGFNATTGAFAGGGTFGSGQFVPPHVNDTSPPPGKFDVPINTKILINFSDAMADDGSGYLLKDNVKLFEVSSSNAETDVSATAISAVTLDTGKKSAKVTLLATYNSSTGLFKSNVKYRLKVLGGAKSANNITLAPPTQTTNVMYVSEFKTSSTSDTGAPVVVGSFPDNNAANVSTMLGALNVSFSKDLDASTISASTVKLEIGGTAVNGTVEYKPMERMIYFMPQAGLTPNTTYTLTITTGVTGGNGTAISQTVRTFTTASTVDTTAPKVEYASVDDTSIAITFSKPMNAAKATDTLLFPTSILKTSNITLKYGDPGFNAQTSGTTSTIPATAVFSYDSAMNTLQIKGYRDPNASAATFIGKEVYIEFVGVKDLSGTAIVDDNTQNVGKAPIKDSATTKGALGPMAMSGDQSSRMGNFVPQNMSTATFGFAPPVDVKPFNMMAGKTTIYGVHLPISSQIPSGGRIVLTFPVGFDVSAAQQDTNSPMRTDLNGPGTGAPTFKCQTNVTGGKSCGGGATNADETSATGGLADDGVAVNTSLRTVTVFINGATGATNDFLNIDISGIKNSTVPKDFNTSGYTIDIKTKNADGTTVIESLTSMPFFIQAGGAFTLTGNIVATGNDQAGTMKLYLNSPMTGPVDATSLNFSDAISGAADTTSTATYEFTGLSAGEYMLFTDQTITLGAGGSAKEFVGKSMPERIRIDGNTTYNLTLPSSSAAGTTAVTVRIKGPANEPLDIFAGSQTGFRAKQVTLNADADDYENFTINLADGNWFIGVGPQMPKGPMAGPPPTPSYVMQKPVDAIVTNGGSPAIKETSDTANDGILKFTLTGASKSIKGLVKDGNNKIMANAEVFAYSPQGGFGTHTQSKMDGAFTLALNEGSYIVGSFIPGMPSSKEVPVIVNTDGTLLIDGATTAITANAAAASFVLKVAKPDYTISGKVTDGTNVIQGASVNAFCDGSVVGNTCFGSGANANTDSSGNYTLYVKAGTWKVNAFLPQYGRLSDQSVVISTSNATNINFTPSTTGTFKSVAGNVTKGGAAVQGAFIRISGNGTNNEAITDASGNYALNVPTCATAGCYQLKGFMPGVGELPQLTPLAVTDNITAGATTNFVIGASRAITFTLSTAVTSKAFINVFSPSSGQGNHVEIPEGATSTTMQLPNGTYRVDAHIPGVPLAFTDISATTGDTVYTSANGTVVVDGATEGLTLTIPTATLRTVTGTVTDGTTAIANAWVEIMNKDNGVHFGTQSAANGSFTLKVADSSQAYSINAMKPGYFREPTSLTVNGANPAVQTLTLPTATKVITGQVKIGSAGAANAFVHGEKQGGGFSGTQADASGNYSLPVSAGTWRVFGMAEGYAEAELSARVDMSTVATSANNDITLTTQVTLNAATSKPITPASGGTLEDTTTGVKLTIPANALGTSTSAGNIEAKETNNAPATSTAKPVGNAKEIKATDSSGNPVTTLTDNITVEMTSTKAELAAENSSSDSSINTKTETDKIQMAYLDSTNGNWTTLPSSVTYLDASGNATTTVNEDLSNIASVKFSAETSHLSVYAPIVPVDPTPAAVPTGMTVGSATVSTLLVSWTAVVGATGYDIYRSTTSDGVFARLGSEPTVSSGSTVTYTDSSLSANTTYYYKMTSISAAGESGTTSVVNSTTSATASASAGAVVVAPAATPQSAVTAEVKKTESVVKTEVKAPVATTGGSNVQAEVHTSISMEKAPSPPAIAEKIVNAFVMIKKELTSGAKGAEVKTVQEVLKAEGLLKKSSGKMDAATTNAIKKFQEKNGIAKKGVAGYGTLGPKTRAAINEIIAEHKSNVAEAAQATTEQKKTEQMESKPIEVQKPVEPAKPLPTPLIEEKIVKTLVPIEKRLTSGAKGAEVKTMQEVLKAKGIDIDTTGVFDKATKEAIKEFQLQEGILKEGDKTLGTLTVKTRDALNAVVKQEKSVAAEIAKATSASEAQPQQLSEEVTKTLVKLTAPVATGVKSAVAKTVQEVLKAEGLLTKLSGKIDTATTNAIKKFQEKYGIAKKGTPGYGTLGPKTRDAINEMTGK